MSKILSTNRAGLLSRHLALPTVNRERQTVNREPYSPYGTQMFFTWVA